MATNKNQNIAGKGRKRPQLNISEKNLHLDPLNPRLPLDIQNRGEDDLIMALYKYFDVEELAYSMSNNGYFDEEPLVAIPEDLPEKFDRMDTEELEGNIDYLSYIKDGKTQFIVAEGNRRLATVKLLLDVQLQHRLRIKSLPNVTEKIAEDLSILPVIIYPTRKEVLPYLGVRHIAGIKKWEPYAKARYIAHMVEQGKSLDQVQEIVADRSNSARKFYLCYKLIDQVRDEFGYDTTLARDEFSYLLLASGQSPIKDFLGLPTSLSNVNYERPVPTEKIDNLRLLFSWLYGEGTKIPRVLKESRDITNYLSPILKSPAALEHLTTTRELVDAYDRSGGEENLLITYLKKANSNLGKSMPFLIKNKNSESVIAELKNCQETLTVIFKIIEN